MSFRDKNVGILIQEDNKDVLKIRLTIGQLLKGGAWSNDKYKIHVKELK